MRVSELIVELQKFLNIQGDLDVKMYADHGQVHMSVDQVALAFTEDKSEYMSEAVSEEDVDGNMLDKVCELG
ncbi:hypothetical protein [Vibrio phage S4-7]|nr:hypothetical protein [Vibrio phage S4-7]